MMRLEAKQRIHDWEVVRPIGRGGMGSVLLCREAGGSRRLVALKTLLDIHSEMAVKQFQREVELLRRLDHPGVAHYIDDRQDPICLVMEYVEGQTLKAIIERDGALSPDLALRLVEELALTLNYVHAKGVWHRDLKPANVIVDERGRVRIVDFGISTSEDMTRVTATGVVMGTPRYMPPEIFTFDGNTPNPTSWDIYSLGVMLFECLTGCWAFKGADLRTMKLALPCLDPGAEYPESLRGLVRRATASRAPKRPKSMAAFTRELRAVDLADGQEQDALEDMLTQVVRSHLSAGDRTEISGVTWSEPAQERDAPPGPTLGDDDETGTEDELAPACDFPIAKRRSLPLFAVRLGAVALLILLAPNTSRSLAAKESTVEVNTELTVPGDALNLTVSDEAVTPPPVVIHKPSEEKTTPTAPPPRSKSNLGSKETTSSTSSVEQDPSVDLVGRDEDMDVARTINDSVKNQRQSTPWEALRSSNVTVLGDAKEVWFRRDGKWYQPGPMPAGVYEVFARFGGEHRVPAGRVAVPEESNLVVLCRANFSLCDTKSTTPVGDVQ